MKPTLLLDVALLLNRLSLGLLFVYAGVDKLRPEDGQSLGEKLSGFAGYVASLAPLPELLGKAYGYALPWVELLAGLLLVLGLLGRVAAGVIALMLLSFLIAMGWGWFGEYGPYDKNVIYMTLAVLLMVAGPGKLSVDSAVFKKKA